MIISNDLIDLLFEWDDTRIGSFANDTLHNSCTNDIPSVITKLQVNCFLCLPLITWKLNQVNALSH